MVLTAVIAALTLASSNLVIGEHVLETDDLVFSEGPLYLPTAGKWIFSDVPAAMIYHLDKTPFAENTNGANGLAVDDEGNVIACLGAGRSIARIDEGGEITVLVDRYEGKRLNAPNDLVIRSDGTIFFTDPQPPRAEELELDFAGVYALSPDGALTLLLDDLRYPNGIAFSPDEQILYVAEMGRGMLRAYDIDGLDLSNGRDLCRVSIPDGMAVDSKGTIWCATAGGVAVINPDGEILETIRLDAAPTNCAFGGADGTTLLVTARNKVFSLQTTRTGMYYAAMGATYGDLIAGPVDTVAEGFQFTEGPVWLPSGKLAFTDIPADTIYLADRSVLFQPSGKANGLTIDYQGRLIRCEHWNRRVTRVETDGSITVLADRYEGKLFNSPNDAIVRSDGAVFFTDPPYGLEGREQEHDVFGVYVIKPDGAIGLIADDFVRPNGIALSPDEQTLYVADTQEGHIRAFKLAADGSLSDGRVLFDIGFPDGMAIDVEGNIWATGVLRPEGGAVGVFDPEGNRLAAIPFPQNPANCAFGGPDGKTLFATARTAVYSVRTTKEGLLPRLAREIAAAN